MSGYGAFYDLGAALGGGLTRAEESRQQNLLAMAQQAGFIDPTDARYQRFMAPEQIAHFNAGHEADDQLKAAHALYYQNANQDAAHQRGELDVKRFLDSTGLGDPTGFQALMIALDPDGAGKAFNAQRAARWSAGGRNAFTAFGTRAGWRPEELQGRLQALDSVFGYQAPAAAPAAPATPAAPGVPSPVVMPNWMTGNGRAAVAPTPAAPAPTPAAAPGVSFFQPSTWLMPSSTWSGPMNGVPPQPADPSAGFRQLAGGQPADPAAARRKAVLQALAGE